LIGAAAIALLVYGAPAGGQAGNPYLRISFIDVGQGDAIWIKGPDGDDGTPGANLIIDGGPDRRPKNRLLTYLQAQSYGLQPSGIIDCIVSTHPHDDHYPGLIDVLDQYQVRTIVDSGFPKPLKTKAGNLSDFGVFRERVLKEQVGNQPSRLIELRGTADRTLPCGNLDVDVLHADSADLKDMGSGNTRENNASTVIRLRFGAFRFLFMGDAEGKERNQGEAETRFVERLLVDRAKKDPDLLRADVLKVGHHGSETGSTLEFIRAVQPEVIVIMSGRKMYNGTYLPDQAVLNRYRRERPGLRIVRTDLNDQNRNTLTDADGDDVYMYTDGETLLVSQAVERNGRKVWRRVATLVRELPVQ
jgi:beta-lactamase superfamily II metal-dependent hydrolase